MEIWDAFDENGKKLGVDLIRGEAIPKGMYHGVAEVFVMHTDDTILLMKRDKNKESNPGKWESSAGGSMVKGEEFYEAARRELREETGIQADELTPTYHTRYHECIFQGYFCRYHGDKDAIRFQEGETEDYQWVTKEEFMKIYHSDDFCRGLKRRLADIVENDFDFEKNKN